MKKREEHDTTLPWDLEYDVVVVGFGGAGACAAIEAADRGAGVVVIDRFTGGGATKMSGGVIYSGGGTIQQKAAGFRDTPDMMYRYMKRELESNPGPSGNRRTEDKTLRQFCRESAENLKWLEAMGLVVPPVYFPKKTNQPPGGYGLYFSGNEKQYSGKDEHIPRGHVPLGKGMSGGYLYSTLRNAAAGRGIRTLFRCRSDKLIIGGKGEIAGIEARVLRNSLFLRMLHDLLYNIGFVSSTARNLLRRLEDRFGDTIRIRARGGVIIASGGFVYDHRKFSSYAPDYRGCFPLGTAGDDGSGLELGQSAGGVLDSMEVCAASRFIYPPVSFVSGILANLEGKRFCDESLYGASLSRNIARQTERSAYLVIDSKIFRDARQQTKTEEKLGRSLKSILMGEMNAIIYRKLTVFVNLHINRKKSMTIPGLAKKCGIPERELLMTVEKYNRCGSEGGDNEFGKAAEYLRKIESPPFYAIDCRIDRKMFPSPCLTMGGLKIKGLTSEVVKADGTSIPGLYAAGRSASGVCSRSYVSGFSLADCVFSGRNAGRHAAVRALKN